MPRYALLRHDVPADFGRPSHWDLLLEDGDSCLTWALEELPSVWSTVVGNDDGVTASNHVAASSLTPHRLHYLSYEGPVSDNRGEVRRVACGKFEWRERSDHRVIAHFVAGTLTGQVTLERGAGTEWKLTAE